MYLIVKLLHVAAVVLFLGNIVTGLFWHAHAARSRNPMLLAHAMDGIILSDRLFTVPGVVAIIASGVALAILGGFPLLHTGWILWSLILFSASGLAFMIRVAPLQRQLLKMAHSGAQSNAFQYERYRQLALRWELWGAIALFTPLAAMALMILKPIP
jgi:uncharacterized membrane protein